MFFLLLLLQFMLNQPALASDTLAGCPDKCGNITIPYPFGTETGCYLSAGFRITCNTSYDPPKAFVTTTNIEITDISQDGTVVVNGYIARDCYKPLDLGPDIKNIWINVAGLPYSFSYTRNKFTALGCDTVALNYEDSILDYSSGCVSYCNDLSSIVNGTCSGIGCCQTAIPKGLKRMETTLSSLRNHTATWNVSPCSYAFLVDQQQFVFNVTDLNDFYMRKHVPVVMDWAIGSDTCEAADASGELACGVNSNCTNSTNGPGYRCICKSGYQGNPYLSHGCQGMEVVELPFDSSYFGCIHLHFYFMMMNY